MERLSHILANLWNVKVNNLILPPEIVNVILSFCSRKTLMRIAITNKQLYNALPIDYNQETVAKNGDMFSLLKITYCPNVVINIAARNNNIIMINYLIYNCSSLLYDPELSESIGFGGNEYLLTKLANNQQWLNAFVGFFQSSHIDLLEKYVPIVNFKFDHANNQTNYINAYRNMVTHGIISNFSEEQIKKYTIKYLPHNFFLGTYEEQKIFVYCATQTTENIKIYIESLHYKFMEHRAEKDKEKEEIDNQYYNSNTFIGYFWKDIYFVLKGLIYAGNYELFVWFQNKYGKDLYQPIHDENTYYTIYDDNLIIMLIKNNNLELFSLIISDYYQVIKKQGYHSFYFDKFVKNCIDYKRLNMLEYLFTNIDFCEYNYRSFHKQSKVLKFKDVTDIILKYANFRDEKLDVNKDHIIDNIFIDDKKDIILEDELTDNKTNLCIMF